MGKYHEEKIEIMKTYLGEIVASDTMKYHIKGSIPSKKINN